MRSLSNVIKASQVKVGGATFTFEGLNFATIEEPEQEEVLVEDMENVIDEIAMLRSQTVEELALLKKNAEEEIALMRKQMLDEMEAKQAEIFEEARSNGYSEGVHQAEQAMEEQVTQAQDIRINAEKEREALLAGVEREIADIILGISKHLLGTYVDYNKEYILYLIKSGLKLVKGKKSLRIRISSDEDMDQEAIMEQLNMVNGQEDMEIVLESDLHKGDCFIEAEDGSIDISLNTQIEKLEEYVTLLSHDG